MLQFSSFFEDFSFHIFASRFFRGKKHKNNIIRITFSLFFSSLYFLCLSFPNICTHHIAASTSTQSYIYKNGNLWYKIGVYYHVRFHRKWLDDGSGRKNKRRCCVVDMLEGNLILHLPAAPSGIRCWWQRTEEEEATEKKEKLGPKKLHH